MLPNLINLGTEKWYVNADNAMLDIDIPELVWIGGIGFKSSYDSTPTDKSLHILVFTRRVAGSGYSQSTNRDIV